MRTTSDETQLEFATREKRVLVTHDDDFLEIASRNINYAGIAYCHQGARTIGQIIEMLILIYEVYQPEDRGCRR